MAKLATMSSSYTPLLIVLVFLSVATNQCVVNAATDRKIHIVYMGAQPKEPQYHAEAEHLSVLEQILESSSAQESLVYSYRKSFNGFSAWLTDTEQKKIVGMKGVVSVFPSTTLQLLTTRSWDFLGLPTTVKRVPDVESDTIIGVIDSGIWPESESFNSKGIGPPPSRWKGACQSFKCNNKIIGARFYRANGNFTGEEKSPRDTVGHGSHTASTAAGREVNKISYFGIAEGTARGAVPSARIAVYKPCFTTGCDSHDILAALDDAIADGVDVINLSIGGGVVDFSIDVIAIGAFHAIQKGIVVSAAVGNDGPKKRTASNLAPWIITVGSSNMDRIIKTNVTLGNQISIEGISLNAFPTPAAFSPLISTFGDSRCTSDGLDKKLVEGKIIVCSGYIDFDAASRAGVQGVLVVSDIVPEAGSSFPLPTTVITPAENENIALYSKQTRNPTALIHRSDSAFDSKAPSVVSGSSRGPSVLTPQILKPDICAPGVEILAAYSPKAPVSGYTGGKNSVTYNVLGGTSMASPHVSGAAAYVKTFHPSWSPAAIKSALMTTATPMKTADPTEDEFAYGAGEINPVKAANPGLVYDTLESDYIAFFCNLGYTTEQISVMIGRNVNCGNKNGTDADLNYPSITSQVKKKSPFNVNIARRVTNVGSANSVYKATVSAHPALKISVSPSVLSFKSLDEKQDFVVSISGGVIETNSVVSGSLTWSDGVHSVRSPIVVLVEY